MANRWAHGVLLLAICMTGIPNIGSAAGFQELSTNLDKYALSAGTVALGDFDADGDADVAMTGYPQCSGEGPCPPISRVLRNEGGGRFTELPISASLRGTIGAAIQWIDHDQDGHLDLFITGTWHDSADLYRGDGKGGFERVSFGSTKPWGMCSDWEDYDGDGDLDLVITNGIYRNDGNAFTLIQGEIVDFVTECKVKWADFDSDGRPDFYIGGDNIDGYVAGKLYRNLESGTFKEVSAPFPVLLSVDVEWADFNRDGRPDLLLTGSGEMTSPSQTLLYKNLGAGAFVEVSTGIPGMTMAAAAWGDFDNDGWSDLLISSPISIEGDKVGPISRIYRNDQGTSFQAQPVALRLPEHSGVRVQWIDVDGDGSLDTILHAADFTNRWTSYTKIYLNR